MAQPEHGKIPSNVQRGVVVMFDAERGFGFIRPASAPDTPDRDVYVNVRNVEGRKVLHTGQRVSYYLTRTDKGLAAIKVQPGSVLGIPHLRFALTGIGAALLLLLTLATALDRPASSALWIGLWVAAISLTTFSLFGWDKAQSKGQGTRVPEVVLHLLAALGGTPGAFLAMHLFRHKISKSLFQAIFWIIVAAQLGALAWRLLNR